MIQFEANSDLRTSNDTIARHPKLYTLVQPSDLTRVARTNLSASAPRIAARPNVCSTSSFEPAYLAADFRQFQNELAKHQLSIKKTKYSRSKVKAYRKTSFQVNFAEMMEIRGIRWKFVNFW